MSHDEHAHEGSDERSPPRQFAGEGGWLEWVYASPSSKDLRERYDAWATSYDRHIVDVWQALLEVGVGLLASHLKERDARVLDAGAGTGLVGQSLARHGYSDLTAVDLSPAMLEQAQAKGVYRELRCADLEDASLFSDGPGFAAVIAMGVFAHGHAGEVAVRNLVRLLRPGGLLVLSVHQNYGDRVWPALAALPVETLQRETRSIYEDQLMDIEILQRCS